MDKRHKFLKWSFSPSKKSSVSSAYWICEIGLSSFPTWKPLMRLRSSPELKIWLNASAIRWKEKELRGPFVLIIVQLRKILWANHLTIWRKGAKQGIHRSTNAHCCQNLYEPFRLSLDPIWEPSLFPFVVNNPLRAHWRSKCNPLYSYLWQKQIGFLLLPHVELPEHNWNIL